MAKVVTKGRIEAIYWVIVMGRVAKMAKAIQETKAQVEVALIV